LEYNSSGSLVVAIGAAFPCPSADSIAGRGGLPGGANVGIWDPLIGADIRNFQMPSSRSTPIPQRAIKMNEIKLINYDFAKYGGVAKPKRLLDKWDKEVYAARPQ